jgi:hypothetical protein
VQAVSGAGEVALFGDSEEALELTQVHRVPPESGSHWRRRVRLGRALWGRLLRGALNGESNSNMLLRLRSVQADGCLRHRAWHWETVVLNVSDGTEGWRLAGPSLTGKGADSRTSGGQVEVGMADLGGCYFQVRTTP